MNEHIFYKVIGSIIAAAITGFLTAGLSMKIGYEKMKTRHEGMEKNILDKIDVLERLMETQSVHLEKEIGELKNEVRTIRRDLYRPRTND